MNLKKIFNIFYWLLLVFLVSLALLTAFSVIKAPWGLRFFVVQSGSMSPSIKAGSIVAVKAQKEYKEGDIITFLANPNAGLKDVKNTITHRIVSVHNDEGRPTYKTKGDANEDEDREMVVHRAVLGRVIFHLPYLGYAVAFTKTQTGFIFVIVIPATLIIYSELGTIIKEIKILIEKLKEKQKTKNKKLENKKIKLRTKKSK